MTLNSQTSEIMSKAWQTSESGITEMRKIAQDMFVDETSFVIGVNGSYARREVTSGSDVDVFFLYESDDSGSIEAKQEQYLQKLSSRGYKAPAKGGVFEQPLSIDEISAKIGGLDDDNKHITRRMLLLLEGEWIFGSEKFESTRERLLQQYVSNNIRDDQICLFLLNDIIRYWRTICVDYEHKINKENKAKAIRLLKLRFSRMLLFVAGVLAVSETFNLTYENKIKKLIELLAIPPYERVQKVVSSKADEALSLYTKFVQALDTKAIRAKLSQDFEVVEECSEYTQLIDTARGFRDALLEILRIHCVEPNPTLQRLML